MTTPRPSTFLRAAIDWPSLLFARKRSPVARSSTQVWLFILFWSCSAHMHKLRKHCADTHYARSANAFCYYFAGCERMRATTSQAYAVLSLRTIWWNIFWYFNYWQKDFNLKYGEHMTTRSRWLCKLYRIETFCLSFLTIRSMRFEVKYSLSKYAIGTPKPR